MDTSTPLISVVIPVFNGVKYLLESVESVLAEKALNLEVIVFDDGSTDGSLDTIRDLPVQRHRREKNLGLYPTLNDAMEVVTGDYVTFLDADDRLAPGGLSWRFEYLEKNKDVIAVGGRPGLLIDCEGKPVGKKHLLSAGYQAPEKISLPFYQGGGLYPTLIWLYLFRRSAFTQPRPFDESYRIASDCDFMFGLLSRYEIPIVFKPAVDRRLHEANLSQIGDGDERKLKPETIAEVRLIAAKHGMKIPEDAKFHLWEDGYGV